MWWAIFTPLLFLISIQQFGLVVFQKYVNHRQPSLENCNHRFSLQIIKYEKTSKKTSLDTWHEIQTTSCHSKMIRMISNQIKYKSSKVHFENRTSSVRWTRWVWLCTACFLGSHRSFFLVWIIPVTSVQNVHFYLHEMQLLILLALPNKIRLQCNLILAKCAAVVNDVESICMTRLFSALAKWKECENVWVSCGNGYFQPVNQFFVRIYFFRHTKICFEAIS